MAFNFMFALHKNVYILTLAQAFIGAIGPLVVFVGGFVGLVLAPSQQWATLPLAFMIVGVSSLTLPVVNAFAKIGRKLGIILCLMMGMLSCGLAAVAIAYENFWLLCAACFGFGFPLVAAQQFRFIAMESGKAEDAGQAVSTLLFGGLLAAFIGPELGFFGKDLLAVDFSGSFALLAGSIAVGMILVTFYQPVVITSKESHEPQRPLSTIMAQPVFLAAVACAAIGYTVMSLIMSATPISMHAHNAYSLDDTKWVIQSHIVAMYLPSLFTGKLIKQFGVHNILYAGVLILFVCVGIAFVDQAYIHYFSALVLLGVGWNFLFIGATTLLPKSYHASEKFKVQATNDFAVFSGQAFASLFAGVLVTTFYWSGLLIFTLPLLVIALISIWYWRRQKVMVANA